MRPWVDSLGKILFRPWLWMPSAMAHDVAPFILPLLASFTQPVPKTWRPFKWRGLFFANPMGVAGGVDKSGRCLASWNHLGAGFLEVGTITPEPQEPLPGKIMDRHFSKQALWNRMGFPNPGLHHLGKQLEAFDKQGTPLFINIGKNRWTSNDQAHKDYMACIKALHPYGEAFVINLSSPNTEGLRDLVKEVHLKPFLSQIREQMDTLAVDKPLLLKLSPDMDESTLAQALSHSAQWVEGWVLTNTSQSRYPHCPFPSQGGGVSGEPLKPLSRQALRVARPYKEKFPEKLLVSVGGVGTASEICYRLEQGADLVQMYSALVFQGPFFFSRVLRELHEAERLEE